MYYYPRPFPCVVQDGLIRVERRLPRDGEIQVEAGQRVAADEVVAVARGQVPPVTIDAAAELGAAPVEVIKGLAQELGASVKTGDVLVSLRAGLRRKDLKAREDGVLLSADGGSGRLLFQPLSGRYELKAFVAGTINDIDGRRGVTIATPATRVQGIWGLGGETVGVLRVLTRARDEDLRPEAIDARVALAVVVGGRSASAEALKKAASAGVKAIVLGSLDEAEFRAFASTQGRVEPRWYVGGPDWQLPAPSASLPFTIIVTEGFGRLPMAPEVYAALHACEGREVSLSGGTRLRHWLQRPEIIAPTVSRSESRGDEVRPATLQPGVRVRLVDPGRLGHSAAVVSPPAVRPLGEGILSEVVEVELDGGGRRHLSVSSVEVLH